MYKYKIKYRVDTSSVPKIVYSRGYNIIEAIKLANRDHNITLNSITTVKKV